MPYQSFKLDSIQDVVTIAESLPYFWFRGHARAFDDLTPGVFRAKVHPHFDDLSESQLFVQFEMFAASVSGCPPEEDATAWLFLMQHHGLPTRLLDWTQSVLVGVFFAVNEHDDEDAELWAMAPGELNKVSINVPAVVVGLGKEVEDLAMQARSDPRQWEQRKCRIEDCCVSPVAIAAPSNFPRLASQHSAFTIHPRPGASRTIVESLSSDHLVRYVIPADRKKALRSTLAALGISYRTLFPDLDGIAKSVLYERERLKGVPKANIPKCGGPV